LVTCAQLRQNYRSLIVMDALKKCTRTSVRAEGGARKLFVSPSYF